MEYLPEIQLNELIPPRAEEPAHPGLKANYGAIYVTEGEETTHIMFMDFYLYGLVARAPLTTLDGLYTYIYASFENPDNIGQYQTLACQTQVQNKQPDEDEFDDNPVITNFYGPKTFVAD